MTNRYEPNDSRGKRKGRQPDDVPNLFDPPTPDPRRPVAGKAGRDHPDTSKRAAAHMKYKVGSQKAKLLLAIYEAGDRGLNAAEGAPFIERSRNQCGTRMGELRDDGFVTEMRDDTGRKVERPTGPDDSGVVHVCTEMGRRAAREYLGAT